MQQHVGILHQQATGYALHVQLGDCAGPGTAFEQTYVLFGGHGSHRFGADFGRNDDFDELALDDGLRRLAVEPAVEGDDAAEG